MNYSEILVCVMASVGEAEYESDPEEAKLSLKMRRREASDDEEEEREVEKREKSVRMIESDGESEGQGAAADYDEEEEEEEYDDEEYVEDEEDYEGDEYQEVGGTSGEGHEETVKKVEAVAEGAEGVKQVVGEGTGSGQGIDDDNENNVQGEEGKKENEPFAVPTAGAFYMHDDRFRDNAGGRHRYWTYFRLTDGALVSDFVCFAPYMCIVNCYVFQQIFLIISRCFKNLKLYGPWTPN